MEIIKTVCPRDCPDTCFLDVTVNKGKIINIKGCAEHPITQGFICPRGKGDIKRVYSSQRVLYPFAKTNKKGGGAHSRVSWDDALSRIAEKIRQSIDKYGRQALLLYDYPGNQSFLSWQFPRRLWMALGATTTDYALCSNSGHTGIGLHYGSTYGVPIENLCEAGLVIFWGNNAKVSSPHQWALARKSRKKNDAVIVSIDPRKSETAKASDLWLQPRPGSDVALAYGIARHLISKKAVNNDFINSWTIGFEKYNQEAQRWTPQRVEKLTGLSDKDVAGLTDLIVQKRGPIIFMIGLGLQKSSQGAEAARAVSLLPALLGYHRGFRYSDAQNWNVDWDAISGKKQAPLKGCVVSQVALGEQLAQGDFKCIFVLGSNPAVTLPHLSLVRQGLEREDVFVVVQDTHWSETAYLADVVLPAPTYLEKTDIVFSDHHPFSRLSQRAIDPVEESRHEIEVMQALAKKLERKEPWIFEDPWKALDEAMQYTFKNGDIKDLLEGRSLELAGQQLDKYQTPSGKIEFFASSLPEPGASRLPIQMDISSDDNGFLLLNSSTTCYTHSQFTDVYGPIPERVWINPEDAGHMGIKEGDIIDLYNDLGSVTLKAELTGNVLSGTLWAPRPLVGLNNQPLNALVPGKAQAIGGGPVFNSTSVKIRVHNHSSTDKFLIM